MDTDERCYYGGKACVFAPCSRSPYRENPGSTCSQNAIELMEDGSGNCQGHCSDITSITSATNCQNCIEENLSEECQHLSGASCWYCSGVISQIWKQCLEFNQNPYQIIDCIQQQQTSGCRQCICTLLCYWEAEGDVCKACLEQSDFETLFVNHQSCPQGWIFSSASGTCYKAFKESKPLHIDYGEDDFASPPWNVASRYCKLFGNGSLAQPRSNSSTYKILEALNLQAASSDYWIGGKKIGEKFHWEGDNSTLDTDDWATCFPKQGEVEKRSF